MMRIEDLYINTYADILYLLYGGLLRLHFRCAMAVMRRLGKYLRIPCSTVIPNVEGNCLRVAMVKYTLYANQSKKPHITFATDGRGRFHAQVSEKDRPG